MKIKKEEASNGRKVGAAYAGLANNISKIVADASAKTKDIATKAQESIVNAVDKNGNGKIDVEDFSAVEEKVKTLANAARQGLKDGGNAISRVVGDAKSELDRKRLRPVFTEKLLSVATNVSSIDEIRSARIPSMICIVERDKKRSGSEACSGAVGYRMTVKGMEILNIYEDSARQLGMWFYPNISKTIYYADLYQNNFYICLDEYFDYLKKARVNELEMVAQDLGAKRVQITFKERKKTFIMKNARADVKLEKIKASGSYGKADSEYSSIEIAADVKFSGHDTPVEPKLVYFKNESDIEKLVQMRTGSNKNKIESKIYRFQCNKSSGIKEKEAAQIDAVLGQLKCSGTASISSEAQRESRTDLEYSIEF